MRAAASLEAPGFTLSDDQNAARKAIMEWYPQAKAQTGPQEFYLAGYAGSGKTTVVNAIIEELRQKHALRNVQFGTYTGKAAEVLRRKGNEGAMTLHSLMYVCFEDEATGRLITELNADGPAADADLLVFDECSMVPDWMADDARSFNKPILVIGDPGQLPPVEGAGAFTNRTPDWFFHEIHRQAADNPIIRLSAMVRNGERVPFGAMGQECRVVNNGPDSWEWVLDDKRQVLCGVHRSRWALTERIRKDRGYLSPHPAQDERVLCCRNNKDEGIFNGQIGIVDRAPKIKPSPIGDLLDMRVHMVDADRKVACYVHPYLFDSHRTGNMKPPNLRGGPKVDHFDFGYVLTVHKAQGSQWPAVTVVDNSDAFGRDDPMMPRRWLYTAVTRAEIDLTLIRRGS